VKLEKKVFVGIYVDWFLREREGERGRGWGSIVRNLLLVFFFVFWVSCWGLRGRGRPGFVGFRNGETGMVRVADGILNFFKGEGRGAAWERKEKQERCSG